MQNIGNEERHRLHCLTQQSCSCSRFLSLRAVSDRPVTSPPLPATNHQERHAIMCAGDRSFAFSFTSRPRPTSPGFSHARLPRELGPAFPTSCPAPPFISPALSLPLSHFSIHHNEGSHLFLRNKTSRTTPRPIVTSLRPGPSGNTDKMPMTWDAEARAGAFVILHHLFTRPSPTLMSPNSCSSRSSKSRI